MSIRRVTWKKNCFITIENRLPHGKTWAVFSNDVIFDKPYQIWGDFFFWNTVNFSDWISNWMFHCMIQFHKVQVIELFRCFIKFSNLSVCFVYLWTANQSVSSAITFQIWLAKFFVEQQPKLNILVQNCIYVYIR